MSDEILMKAKAEEQFKSVIDGFKTEWKELDKENIKDIIVFKDMIINAITSWKMMGIDDEKLYILSDIYFESIDVYVKLLKEIKK